MAGRTAARPRFDGYWCVSASVTASCIASTISAGVGRSGSPMPRLITSTPAARLSAILRSSWANAYGGMRSRRLLGFMQLLFELLADTPLEHRSRPACQVDVQILAHLDLQFAAVEHNGHGARPQRRLVCAGVGHRRARRARARGERLPHTALEDPRADTAKPSGVELCEPRHVRAVGELRVAFDPRPAPRRIEPP